MKSGGAGYRTDGRTWQVTQSAVRDIAICAEGPVGRLARKRLIHAESRMPVPVSGFGADFQRRLALRSWS
ncbi:hypothetical protein JKG47_21105 [Acidithiobacillus sp. MC6.1]|nr:hypothetical protein [Acidithiobacillus sp. MC6.1]